MPLLGEEPEAQRWITSPGSSLVSVEPGSLSRALLPSHSGTLYSGCWGGGRWLSIYLLPGELGGRLLRTLSRTQQMAGDICLLFACVLPRAACLSIFPSFCLLPTLPLSSLHPSSFALAIVLAFFSIPLLLITLSSPPFVNDIQRIVRREE